MNSDYIKNLIMKSSIQSITPWASDVSHTNNSQKLVPKKSLLTFHFDDKNQKNLLKPKYNKDIVQSDNFLNKQIFKSEQKYQLSRKQKGMSLNKMLTLPDFKGSNWSGSTKTIKQFRHQTQINNFENKYPICRRTQIKFKPNNQNLSPQINARSINQEKEDYRIKNSNNRIKPQDRSFINQKYCLKTLGDTAQKVTKPEKYQRFQNQINLILNKKRLKVKTQPIENFSKHIFRLQQIKNAELQDKIGVELLLERKLFLFQNKSSNFRSTTKRLIESMNRLKH